VPRTLSAIASDAGDAAARDLPAPTWWRVLRSVPLPAALAAALCAAPGSTQEGGELPWSGELVGEGWSGFGDVAFLGRALLALLLATALGAALAYHPRRDRAADSLEAADAPKVLVLYAAIGAVIGIMVLQYGLVVGFVIFGIGGLARFRSELGSAPDTGRLILVTLIGLACGLELPHLAVLAAAFGFVLLALLDARRTYHVVVKGVARDALARAAEAYREALARERCRVLSERKSVAKEQLAFIVRAPSGVRRDLLAQRLDAGIPEGLRGVVDWEAD
jgi:hypothetical protein